MPTAERRIDERGLELLERDELLERLVGALEAAAAGHGRLILLGGEAGVGKTALLRAFCGGGLPAGVLWGVCERLFTPRALGPFLEVADAAGVELPRLGPHARAPYELFGALAGELAREQLDHVQRPDVGPMHVLDHEHGRRPGRELARQRA